MAAVRIFSAVLIFAVVFPLRAAAEEKPAPNEIVRAIVASRDIPLGADNGCAAASPRPGAKTLGDYLSDLVASFADEQFRGMKLRIESTPGKAGGAMYWDCAVMFEVKDEKSPWGYGIAFRLDDKTRKADPKSFRCPGCC